MQNAVRAVQKAFSAVALLLLAISAQASSQQPFDAKAFKAAQQSGKPVLVEVHADWCPTCKAQVPILDKLSRDAKYSNVVRFRVDFDTQKDALQELKAKVQSTLVLYKGSTEVARSVGETNADNIRAMLNKAL